MNSSAKTTTFTFLAAAALGAAVFMGCTVTSGTVDDTDGGTQNDDDKDSGSSGNNDSGTPDTGGETCNNTSQTNMFEPAACQTCLESKCCLELNNSFNIPNDDPNGKLGCNDFKACLDDCAKPNEDGTAKTEDEIQECIDTTCNDPETPIAVDGVVTAWQSVQACAAQSCATECAGE